MMIKPKVIFLVGPTAVGKTAVGSFLAKKLNAEIIACDSMQVYKGMDIITSKPTPALRKRIPHHLIDVVSPDKIYNASRYRREAMAAVKKILKSGKMPLFIGGTGLYLSVFVDGIFESKAGNKAVSKELYRQLLDLGAKALHKRLVKVDPQAARKIHPNDAKRIVRALEVYLVTGQAISKLQKERRGISDKYDLRIFCLDMDRPKLYQRIEKRVDRMFSEGLVKEVKKLLKGSLGRTARYAIGIKELEEYFAGRSDLKLAKERMKLNTRHYAKRQLTWFRKDKRISWVLVGENEKAKEVADKIWKELY